MSLSIGENGSVTLSPARATVCIEAAWELEELAYLLASIIPPVDELMREHFRVGAVAGRIETLSNALMSGLNDEAETTDALERAVLVKLPVAKVAESPS